MTIMPNYTTVNGEVLGGARRRMAATRISITYETGISQMRRTVLVLVASGTFSACSVGPDYVPALTPIPEKFKELHGRALKGFKLATPRESVDAEILVADL